MARVKRLLKRSPGILALIGFTIVYGFGELPLISLGEIKHPELKVQLLLTVLSILAMSAVAWFIWQYYRQLSPVKRFYSTPKYPVIFMAVMVIMVLIIQFIPTPTSTNQAGIDQLMRVTPVGTIFSTVIAAPVCEELLFRGIFFRKLLPTISSWQTGIIGVIVSALVFGGLHASLFSVLVIPYVLMGAIFAVAYLAFNDLRYSMALHCLSNLIATILFFI